MYSIANETYWTTGKNYEVPLKHFKLVILCRPVNSEYWSQNRSTCSSALQAKQIVLSVEGLLWMQEEEMDWEEKKEKALQI